MEEVRRRGISPTKMGWRLPEDHSIITLMDTAVLDDVDGLDIRTACLVLNDLDQLMLERFLERNGDIRWQHKVVRIGQDENKAWVDAETPQGTVRVEADYIVGCDGANSIIRRGLFGNEYPGFTWDKQIVATNVRCVASLFQVTSALNDAIGLLRLRQVRLRRLELYHSPRTLLCKADCSGYLGNHKETLADHYTL
jgi:2-polyprenyl-6-methoxyphenol hydroxylase-like FAD-dependent oxidoreductase